MAMPYPYTNSRAGLVATIRQLRSAFPPTVSAETLKMWNVAPKNETYVLNVLRFLGFIDEEGKKQKEPAKVFLEHDDETFAKKLEPLVNKAYVELFENFGESAWTQDTGKLISFFRTADGTSANVGSRQARTFRDLASLSGHGPPPAKATSRPAKKSGAPKKARAERPRQKDLVTPASPGANDDTSESSKIILTVRVEVNLPITDDQEVYNKIFKSLRQNLLNE